MKRNRISAGILLAVGILVLLYTGSYGMFCVLAAVLFLLLCLAIYTVLAGRNLAGYIQLPENGEKKARISGKICIENHSILPLFCVGCDLYWANRLTGEKGKEFTGFQAAMTVCMTTSWMIPESSKLKRSRSTLVVRDGRRRDSCGSDREDASAERSDSYSGMFMRVAIHR